MDELELYVDEGAEEMREYTPERRAYLDELHAELVEAVDDLFANN